MDNDALSKMVDFFDAIISEYCCICNTNSEISDILHEFDLNLFGHFDKALYRTISALLGLVKKITERESSPVTSRMNKAYVKQTQIL